MPTCLLDPEKNKNIISDEDIPNELKMSIIEKNQSSLRKKEESKKEKDMIQLKIFYNGNDRTLSLHNKTTIEEATKAAAELFEISHQFERSCYQLRNFQIYYEIPQDSLAGKEDQTLSSLNYYSPKSLMLETRAPDQEFLENRTGYVSIRKLDPETLKFTSIAYACVDHNTRLIDLKNIIEEKLKIPVEKQRLVAEQYPPETRTREVTGDEKLLQYDLSIEEGTKIYVEESKSPESELKVVAEIKRLKNSITISYNIPPETKQNNKLLVDKTITLEKFRGMLQPLVGLSHDDFKIFRGVHQHKTELSSDNEALKDLYIHDNCPIFIEKGRAMKSGEVRISVQLFEPFKQDDKTDYLKDLFEVIIDENTSVPSFKEILAEKLKAEKNIEVSATHIRLRDMISKTPNTIYHAQSSIKDNFKWKYGDKVVALQILSEPEPLITANTVTPFLQKWNPDKYTADEKFELTLSKDMPLSDLKAELSTISGIPSENIGLARGQGWLTPSALEIPNLVWDRPNYYSNGPSPISMSPLYLRDSELLLFRDNTLPLKELTTEERNALRKKEASSRRGNEEKALTINVN
eukprot:TRINITY_DN1811_c0_g5_i1.p2 TRINITY_DN1811_c0_g5~~TRINITY_DN1811_c0_g5_i1.p2  ORF type:complete len:578 (+),score=134.00 TRINITY_DN1811_c0_g5_i1:1756-3489(+)